MSLEDISEILLTLDDDAMKKKQNELIDALGGIKKIIGLIVEIGTFFDKTNNLDHVLEILNDINTPNIDEYDDSKYEYKPLLNLASATITDKCLDHHYDAFILDVNDKTNNLSKSFGLNYNDIAIKSQLQSIKPEQYDVYSRFISDIISCQCSRIDPMAAKKTDIEQRRCEFIKNLLFNKENKKFKEIILIRYQSTNLDTTNLHSFQITLKQNEDDKYKELVNDLQSFYDDTGNKDVWPDHVVQDIINKLQFDDNFETIKKKQTNTDIPLFIHHFYPKTHDIFINILDEIFKNSLNSNIIKEIVEFMFEERESIYYDCWYLKRNIKAINIPKVTICDKLLFNSRYYDLVKNPYHGLYELYSPSQSLLNNNNNSLQNIINEIKSNNILNVFRFIIWGIILNINPSNKLLRYNMMDITMDAIKNCVDTNGEVRETMLSVLQYAFGGNTFDVVQAAKNIFTVQCFGFKYFTESSSQKSEKFKAILDSKINKFNSVVIPDIHLLYKNAISHQDFEIWETFQQCHHFPVNIKCYLIQTMFIYGISGLALNFSAYLKAQYNDFSVLIQSFMKSRFDDGDEGMMAKLYSFNDVKSMNELFLEFVNELKSKYIEFKQNPHIVPYGWYALTD